MNRLPPPTPISSREPGGAEAAAAASAGKRVRICAASMRMYCDGACGAGYKSNHVPQKLTGLISLYTDPASILTVPMKVP
jgi:hypothetical protein